MVRKNILLIHIVFIFCFLFSLNIYPQSFKIARLKYSGGGDWYANPTSLPNLAKFIKKETGLNIEPKEAVVSIMDYDLFSYPFLYITGHGKIFFSDEEAERLRRYLLSGGFLHVDDNFGLDKYFRKEIKKVFPDRDLVEIPFNHPIYHIFFSFPNGLPKIHEHTGAPAQGFGIFDDNGRLVLFYSFECDLGDGWEDPEVHNDPEEKRIAALKMGTNIFLYSLMPSKN